MKNIIIITLLILMFAGLNSAVNYENGSNYIDIQISNAGELSAENGVFYSTLAFPAREVSLQIIKSEVNIFDNAGNQIESQKQLGSDRIAIEETMIMRDLIMHRIRIELERDEAGLTSILDSATIRLQVAGEIENINTISSVFAPIYSKLIDNYETSYLRNLPEMPAKMLIISHSSLTNLSYFTDWKNERGVATEVLFKSDLGNTTVEIKSHIQEIYDSEDNPPDYLLLIGDVNGAFAIPSYYHSSENDVTDHPFTLLDGDDYFPEMIVGRFSIDQADNLNTIISKILSYEKTPYMTNPEWFDNMVIVAGNYSDELPIPTTPVTTSMWLAEKAANYGYDDITEIYYWIPDYPNYPATTDIRNAINAGAGIVAYRGWGNAWGWSYPYFHTENIQQLTNGFYLPVMTSVVCNTGDFANVDVDPCFGELWLLAGNATNPKGGVAFVGPSDLHTQTNYNNSIYAGFYQGLLDEGIHSFGAAVLRGKSLLYQNFPINHGEGDYVEFYFYVYNILGDPSLNIWTKTPLSMSCDLPEEISFGQNHLDIYVPEIENGIVTARKEGEFLVSEFVRNHSATLFFNAATEGTLDVTITAINHLPVFAEVDIVTQAIDPTITNIAPQSELLAGEEVTVDVTLTNQGSQSAEFIAEIDELTGMAEIENGSLDFGILNSGASVTLPVIITIADDCQDGYELSFSLYFEALGITVKFPLTVNNIILSPVGIAVNDANGILEPGETAAITMSIANIGNLDAFGLNASITSATTALIINNGSDTIGDLAVGSSGDATFNVTADAEGFNGRDAGIYLHLEDGSGRVFETSTLLTIGVVTNTDPTGPCIGGYYAYDSFDMGYNEAPAYFWQEIDPDLSGSGEVILMIDDQSNSIPLPFSFTYFDVEYDSITVSSNGWISFETTWQDYFRNWLIPGALGPYAQVAAYWDDLVGPGGGVEDLRLCYYYDMDEDYFIIEWSNAVNREDNVSVEKFEIVLYDPAVHTTSSGNGIIQVNYHTINNPDTDGNYCTVGIEDQLQEHGLLYSYASLYPESATVLQNGLAIRFTTEAPDDLTDNDLADLLPQNPVLHANYPNPFNPETTISFSLPEAARAELSVYNIKGEKVKTIISGNLEAGDHGYTWQGDDEQGRSVSSGVYFFKFGTDRYSTTKKCVLMK